MSDVVSIQSRWVLVCLLLAACSKGDDVPGPGGTAGAPVMPGMPPQQNCQPGASTACTGGTCPDGQPQTALCNAAGAYEACTCPVSTGMSGAGVTGAGSGGVAPTSGTGGTGGMVAGGTGGSVTPPESANTWTQMGGDARNWYFNAAEKTLSVDNAATLAEKWRFTIAGYPPGSPVVAAGKVFVMATGGTYAIDLQTGLKAWERLDLKGTASVAYDDGFVYVHTSVEAELHKLNASDGMTVWGAKKTYSLAGCDGTSSPILSGDLVIVGHSCGQIEIAVTGNPAMARGGVEAHSKETGDNAWTYFTVPDTGENGAMVWSSVGIDEAGGTVFAATGNNYTVAGENSDSIHAIDLATGMKKWKRQVRTGDTWSIPLFLGGPDSDFGANPIIFDLDGAKIVAAGDKGTAFWALDRDTGEILWSRPDLSANFTQANGGVLMNGGYDGKYIYVVSNQPPSESVLHALDPAQEGADAWPPKTFPKIAWGAPSMANGLLVVPIDDDLYVYNAHTGDELNKFNTGGTIAAGAAAIAEGKIIVQSGLQYPLGTVLNNNQVICYGLP
jgi:outer membrane protein assembly factor BamB